MADLTTSSASSPRGLLLVLLLAVSFVGSTLADVSCFQCTGCGGSRDKWTTCTGKSCVKVTGKVADATVRSHDCWRQEEQDSCSYGDAAGGEVTTCFCTVDFCNSAPAAFTAPSGHISRVLVLLTLAAFTAQVVRSRW